MSVEINDILVAKWLVSRGWTPYINFATGEYRPLHPENGAGFPLRDALYLTMIQDVGWEND